MLCPPKLAPLSERLPLYHKRTTSVYCHQLQPGRHLDVMPLNERHCTARYRIPYASCHLPQVIEEVMRANRADELGVRWRSSECPSPTSVRLASPGMSQPSLGLLRQSYPSPRPYPSAPSVRASVTYSQPKRGCHPRILGRHEPSGVTDLLVTAEVTFSSTHLARFRLAGRSSRLSEPAGAPAYNTVIYATHSFLDIE